MKKIIHVRTALLLNAALLIAIQFALMPQRGFGVACREFYEKECTSCGVAMAAWWVAQPSVDLHLDDTPLGYQPSRGLPVQFRLSYRQRELMPEDPTVFGVGTNWTSSFRTFLVDKTGVTSGWLRLHRGGAGEVDYYQDYYVGTPQFFDGSLLTTPDAGLTYQIEYADGAKDVFAKTFVNSGNNTCYFLTARLDPAGDTLTYNYATNQNIVRLSSVTDPDNRSTQLFYENTSFTNQITKVVDPFSRTNLLQYDASGYLTNIVDMAGLTSSFVYDAGTRRSWITNLITAYGTTTFRFGGVNADSAGYYYGTNQVNRFAEVTLPNGGKHLYLYRQDCSSILSASNSPVPVTSPFANTLDYVDQHQRNSFHWEPLQYIALSTNYLLSGNVTNLTSGDYVRAGWRHWLLNPATAQASRVLSLKRLPSPDGDTPGQVTWLDYAGKAGASSNGTSALPLLEAQVLPNGNTRFERTARNTRGSVTNEVATYTAPSGGGYFLMGGPTLRTNVYVFGTNEVDLIRHVGPEGEQVVSNYFNAYHQPLASYNALNEATVYAYNANHQITSTISPAGLTKLNVYYTSGTDSGRLEKTIDLEINRTNSFTYYSNGLVYSHTNERGLTTYNYWDNLERLVGVWYPDGTTMSNIYTALDITATKDRLGYWSYAAYNQIRLKTAETNANGVVTRYGLCECGALMSVTNAWNTPAQMVTSFGYDYQGNRTFIYNADGYNVTNWYNYDSLRQVTATGDGAAYKWFSYNNQSLRTSVTNDVGAEQITIFDVEDRPLYVLDANGVAITNTYDVLGRLRTRTHPDGGVERFGYSARGLIAYTNQLDKITYYGYDEARRKVAETNANGEIIRYTNNVAGDLLSLTDGKNQTTRWNYDEFGRVTNKLDQAGTEILRYKYDQNNRLTNRWSAAKANTYYSYDPVGNLTNINYLVSPDVTLSYDALNRATNMVDAVGTTKYAYTAGGQLWTEDGPWSDDTVTNTYNNRLRTALSLAQPTGAWTNGFGYDTAKRLTSVTSPAGTFSYQLSATQPSTLIQKLSLPNTSYITNTYDANARLLSTTLKKNDHTSLNAHTYTYNPGNQRTQQMFNVGSTYNYTYDPIGQLKVADSGTASEDCGYTYDTAWNLNFRTNNGTLNTFTVDGLNQLTNSTPGGVSTYDGNGNLVSSGGGALEFAYDDENRLSIVQSNLVAYTNWPYWQTLYYYDGVGRLRLRVERQNMVAPDDPPEESLVSGGEESLESGGGGGIPWGTNSITEYIYDGWRVIQERDGSNVPIVSYTRGTDLSGSLEGAGGIGGLLGRSHGYSSGNWSTNNFYHADGNGNITFLVSSSQTLAARYRYDPYGNLISSSETLSRLGTPNTYRFSSKMADLKTGHYYYGYRWYEPNLQRWLSRDPIGERGGLNLYGFVKNWPVDLFDPFGLYPYPSDAGGCPTGMQPDTNCNEDTPGYRIINNGGAAECPCISTVRPPRPRPPEPRPRPPEPRPPRPPEPPRPPGRSFDHYTYENGVECRLTCYCEDGASVTGVTFSSEGCTCNYAGGASSTGGFGKICGCRWGN